MRYESALLHLWYSFLLKSRILQRVTMLLENIRDAKQSRENWIACARKLGKRKRWELICDEARHFVGTYSRAFRFPIDAQRAPWNVSSKETRQTEGQGSCLLTKPSDAGTDYIHESIADRSAGILRRQKFHPSSTCHFHFLPIAKHDVTSRAQTRKKETLEMTNELGKFFVGFLIHGDNFRAISPLAVSANGTNF